jgi:hypothetical protein
MPKNNVSDPITDQEIAFARLVLAGGMTDRHAAEAVGLNPDSAAYTKSKPRVRDYMLQHRAAVQQQLVQQDADLSRRAVDELRRRSLDREQVLDRLWEIANLSPEMTRGSITGQVKALSMIVAIEGLIPDGRATSSEKKSATAPAPQIHASACPPPVGRRGQQVTTIDPQSSPVSAQQEAQEEDSPARTGVPSKPEFAPASAEEAPPDPGPSQATFANRLTPSEAQPPYVPLFNSVPDLRVPFAIKKNPLNPFVRPR